MGYFLGRNSLSDHFYTGRSNCLTLFVVGYDKERMVKNIRFENLKINGKVISDDMAGKPAWYKTSDMARFFVGEHVGSIVFTK